MLGLIFLQYRWVMDSIAIKQVHFGDKVNKALNHVAHKIEKHEKAQLLQTRIIPRQKQHQAIPNPYAFPTPPPTHNGFATSPPPKMPTVVISNYPSPGYTFEMDCFANERHFDPQVLREQISREVDQTFSDTINTNNAYLGIQLSSNMAPRKEGVTVAEVIPGSPAERAGIRKNDIITSINGRKVKTREDILDELKRYKVNDDVAISYRRNKYVYNPPTGTPVDNNGQSYSVEIIQDQSGIRTVIKEDIDAFWAEQVQDHLALARLSDKANIKERWVRQIEEMSQLAIEWAMRDKPVEERINPSILDSILNNSLADEGINIPYEYCLRTEAGCIYYANLPEISDNLLQTNYKKLVYKDEIFSRPGELLLHFPEEENYVWNSSSMMLGSSLFFNLMIILTFGYTIKSIIRQKNLSDMKTDFINNMTHELKTPISTIKLVCEMLTDQNLQKSPDRLNRYATIIQDENFRLQSHVEKVLQFARLEKGNLKLKMEALNMHDLLEEAVQKTALQVDKQHGQISHVFNATQTEVLGDKLHLTNIIYNLLDNAIKYSQEAPLIEVYTRSDDQFVTVSIKDHGIGMSKEALKRVFDKFYRVSTGNIHNVKGFGLGLSYVKLMTDHHGGNVRAYSKLNKGSTFEFSIPLK